MQDNKTQPGKVNANQQKSKNVDIKDDTLVEFIQWTQKNTSKILAVLHSPPSS